MDEDEDITQRPTAKWMGCANHTLQLALKTLELDSKFNSILSAVTHVLSSIRKSPNAVRDFASLANRSIVLPNNTR